MLTGIAAAGAAGLIGALGSYYTNKANIKANQKRFAQEVELANTAHQREVFDLKAAGLNPILSAGGAGASVPSTAPYEQASPTEGIGGIASALSSASNADLNTANVDKLQSDIAKSDFMARFYQSPVGKQILMNEAIKKASPDNAIQATSMAGQMLGYGLTSGIFGKSGNTSNEKSKKVLSPISDKISQRLRSVYKDMPTVKTSENMRRKFKHK